jgi:hypothetical protein
VRFARSGNLCRLIFGGPRPVRDGLPTRIFKILRFYRHKVKERDPADPAVAGSMGITKMLTLR